MLHRSRLTELFPTDRALSSLPAPHTTLPRLGVFSIFALPGQDCDPEAGKVEPLEDVTSPTYDGCNKSFMSQATIKLLMLKVPREVSTQESSST